MPYNLEKAALNKAIAKMTRNPLNMEELIKQTENYGISHNPDGTVTQSMKLSFEGSVRNYERSVRALIRNLDPENEASEEEKRFDKWGVEEACRMYYEGRAAWLKGDLETVASLFGVLV